MGMRPAGFVGARRCSPPAVWDGSEAQTLDMGSRDEAGTAPTGGGMPILRFVGFVLLLSVGW